MTRANAFPKNWDWEEATCPKTGHLAGKATLEHSWHFDHSVPAVQPEHQPWRVQPRCPCASSSALRTRFAYLVTTMDALAELPEVSHAADAIVWFPEALFFEFQLHVYGALTSVQLSCPST